MTEILSHQRTFIKQVGPAAYSSLVDSRLPTNKEQDDSCFALGEAGACLKLKSTPFLLNIFKGDDLTILQMEKPKLILHLVINSIFLRPCPECRLPGKQLLEFRLSKRAGFCLRLTCICCRRISKRSKASFHASFILATISSRLCCNVRYDVRKMGVY